MFKKHHQQMAVYHTVMIKETPPVLFTVFRKRNNLFITFHTKIRCTSCNFDE